jgi:hypothetical protein
MQARALASSIAALLVLAVFIAEADGAGRSGSASAAGPARPRVTLVSLPDWSLVAWRQGRSLGFNWRGERTSIESVSGCRPPFPGALELLLGETGVVTRIAGLASPLVTSVSVLVRASTFTSATKPLPVVQGRNSRFFFLQFRPPLPPSMLAGAHWTLIARDAEHHTVGTLRV